MDINYYKQYEPIFGSWHITRQIGEGSFGKVFEIEREDFGTTYKAALKAITVPASETELLEVRADGMDDASVRMYFGSFVEELVKEFALMSQLKGNSNVVSYEDHQVIEHPHDIGWDILIRMELLTPLNRYTSTHTVTRQDVIRLGIDLCRALELCQKFNIIHRDIKPENIFVSAMGDFKLGDFGIARTVEKTTSGLSKKGTYTYMAPEVYKGEPYGTSVDIYSLGIVLYRLLNGNRTPFMPAAPAPITHADRENALVRRLSGAPLPAPCHAKGRLAEIVLKACAYDPKERYSSPMQMRQELESILYNRQEREYIYPDGDDVPQDSAHYVKTGEEPPAAETGEDGTLSDFGGTVSDFGNSAGKISEMEEDSAKTVSDFGGTASDFTRSTGKTGDFTGTASQAASSPGKKDRKKVFLGAAAACVVLIAGIAIGTGGGGKDSGETASMGNATGVSDSGDSGKDTGTSNAAASNVETVLPTDGDTIYIGVYDAPDESKFPEEEKESFAAVYGANNRYALEYINNQYPTVELNGKEYQIELVFASQTEEEYTLDLDEDGSLYSAEYEVAAAGLFAEAGCSAVIDAFSGSTNNLYLPMGEDGVPYIDAGDDHTSYLDSEKYFSIWNQSDQDQIALDYAVEELGAGTILFVADSAKQEYEWYVDELEGWMEYAETFGCKAAGPVWYENEDSLSQALAEYPDCDVIYTDFDYPNEGVPNGWEYILEQNACEAAVFVQYQGSSSIPSELGNAYCFDVHSNQEKYEEWNEIVKYIREKQESDSVSLGFFEAVDAYQILRKALAECGTNTDLTSALYNVSLEGLTGNFSFDEKGKSQYTSASYWHQGEWTNYIYD